MGLVYGPAKGASAAAIGQLGLQLNHLFAIYYQPSLLGYGVTRGDDIGATWASGQTGMLELTFVHFLQVGLGGGVDIGNFYSCSAGVCGSRSDTVPSISGRFAFVIGFLGDRARWGIPLAVHAHTAFDGGHRLNTFLFTVGIQRY